MQSEVEHYNIGGWFISEVLQFFFLVLALLLAIIHDGGGFGTLLWIGLASGAACMVALTIAWYPGLLISLTRTMARRFRLTGACLRCL